MLSDKSIGDLAKSGLVQEDMAIEGIDPSTHYEECGITGRPDGYAIRYYDIEGLPTETYRLKLFDYKNHKGKDVKYLQPKGSKSMLYIPLGFKELYDNLDEKYVIITEGEKKASCAVKKGYPAVALSGVFNWRDRKMIFPVDTKIQPQKNHIVIEVPKGKEPKEIMDAKLICEGLPEFLDVMKQDNAKIVFIYDTDLKTGTKPQVQNALMELCYEFILEDVPMNNLKQVILPPGRSEEEIKVGLDDYLMKTSQFNFDRLRDKKTIIPKHPNIKGFCNNATKSQTYTKLELQKIATAVLMDLDANGKRFKDKTNGDLYYFDETDKKLLPAVFHEGKRDAFIQSDFGKILFNKYNLYDIDNKVLLTIGKMFNAIPEVHAFEPKRVCYSPQDKDMVCYQISESKYAEISADGLEIRDNGYNGVMFVSDMVEPVDVKKLRRIYGQIRIKKLAVEDCLWLDVLKSANLNIEDEAKYKKTVALTAMLYYISPFLKKWRGMQIPMELHLGEPNSGKSSLFHLRSEILKGTRKLEILPEKTSDWVASMHECGGLTIYDNLSIDAHKDLVASVSDYLCVSVTERDPTIKHRQLYTDKHIIKIKIDTCFAFSTTDIIFKRKDILERSCLLEFGIGSQKMQGQMNKFNPNWVDNWLTGNGRSRESWLAHHFVVLEQFFKQVERHWDDSFLSDNRLIHFEQSLRFMCRVFGVREEFIGKFLQQRTQESKSSADIVFEAFSMFIQHLNDSKDFNRHDSSEIRDWWKDNGYKTLADKMTENKITRYMKMNESLLFKTFGVEIVKSSNRLFLKLGDKKLI